VLLAQGRFWRASLVGAAGMVALEIVKASLPDDLNELKDMKIEVPLAKWNLVVKHMHSDRKLLGGLLLDFAKNKQRVSAAVGNDRLLVELRRVVLEATVVLVEEEVVVIADAEARTE
jgi:hypothetical protein